MKEFLDSLTPRGVSGLKYDVAGRQRQVFGLTPRGVSGLKYGVRGFPAAALLSHPPRGEWIEIISGNEVVSMSNASHPPRGEWIEICTPASPASPESSLTPRGVSGLKFHVAHFIRVKVESHPPRGEWIEII